MSFEECEGCGKLRRDVRAVGRDADGVPDSPCLCFVCRKESERGREYDKEKKRYVLTDLWARYFYLRQQKRLRERHRAEKESES